ncbi:uncharacterized protein LOC121411368 [Lytechinus variegatus]|uniref:uncharacterized protein LOC121411368 n=1 Tax=Lytechinus variegatus TaxID=7654 RepID=UPI001BB1D383|nr:uncharacterized protein LOC121411368 [Lytechinus variegatus]
MNTHAIEASSRSTDTWRFNSKLDNPPFVDHYSKTEGTAMAAPRILAIIEVDGKEMSKKPVRARTIDECHQEAVKICPQIAALQLQRALVYDKGFEDYIDYDEHVPVENDKIRLQFVSLAQSTSASAVHVHSEVPSIVSSEGASSSPGGEAARASTSYEDNPPTCRTSQATLKFTGGKLSISREPPSQSPPVSDKTDEEIEERAKIFGKDGKNLNKYQKKINEAASRLAKANPTLLETRGLLLVKAREAVHTSGYEYAHGKKTRSKVLGSKKQKKESNYSKETTREDRLEEITEIVQSTETQIIFLEKGKERAVTSNQYGQAAAFEQQISELKLKLRKLKLEKAEIGNKSDALKKRRVRRKIKGSESGSSSKKVKVMGDSEADAEEVNILEEKSMEIREASTGEMAQGFDESNMDDVATDHMESGGSVTEERSIDNDEVNADAVADSGHETAEHLLENIYASLTQQVEVREADSSCDEDEATESNSSEVLEAE